IGCQDRIREPDISVARPGASLCPSDLECGIPAADERRLRGADGAGPGAVARNADCALRVAAPHGRVHTPCGRTPAILRGIRGPSGHERDLGLELLVELRIGFRAERGPQCSDDVVEAVARRLRLLALPAL